MSTTRRTFLRALAGAAAASAAGRTFAQQTPPPTSGPWERDLLLRASADGGDSFGASSTFQARSGVPSLVQDLGGRLYCAFQWFPSNSPHFDRVAVKTSEDRGRTWSDPAAIVVEGYPSTYSRPFDPTLTLLHDGRIRIFFSSNTENRPTLDGGVATYSALSEDGVHYRFEPGSRFAVSGLAVIDPAALRVGDVWHYTAPIGKPEDGAYHAVSADGLDFRRLDDIPSVGGANWTGNLLESGDGMRFYGSSTRGVWWAYSADQGRRWTAPQHLGISGGDPAVVETVEGTVLMVSVS